MSSSIYFSAEVFLKIGMSMLNRPPNKSTGKFSADDIDHFKATFGTTPIIVSVACDLMREHTNMSNKIKPHQILWGLALLKLYNTEKVLCDHIGARDAKNFRLWAWKVVGWIADLEPYVVRSTILLSFLIYHVLLRNTLNRDMRSSSTQIDMLWEDRHNGVPPGEKSTCVDGTDCPTQEPSPFSSRHFSHKFNSAGFRYQVTTSRKGDLIDVDGPHRPGCKYGSEKAIFERGVMSYLDDGEECEGDKYYRKQIKDIFTGYLSNEERKFAARFRARHESLNGRLKRFQILTTKFRAKPAFQKHSMAFRAIAVLCQLEIETSSSLFEL